MIIYVHLWKRLYTLYRELNHNQHQENSMLNESISFKEIEHAICIRNLMTQLRLILEIETGRFRPIYDKSIKIIERSYHQNEYANYVILSLVKMNSVL